MTTYTKKQAPDKVHASEVKHDLRKVHRRLYAESKKVSAHRTIITSSKPWHQVFSGHKPSGVTTGKVIYGEAGYDTETVRLYVTTVDGSTPTGTVSFTVTNVDKGTSESSPSYAMASYKARIDVDIDISEGDLFEVEFTGDNTLDYNINAWLLVDSGSLSTTIQAAEE